MENQEWIIPARFDSRDAAAGLRSIDEGGQASGDLGQAAEPTSDRFRKAHESIASASRHQGRPRTEIRGSGPEARGDFSGSVVKGLAKEWTGATELARSLESRAEGPSPVPSIEASEKAGDAPAPRRALGRAGSQADPSSKDGHALPPAQHALDPRGWGNVLSGDGPRPLSTDASPGRIAAGPVAPNGRNHTGPPGDGANQAGSFDRTGREGPSILVGRDVHARSPGKPGPAIETDGIGLGTTEGESAALMGRGAAANYRAWTTGPLDPRTMPASGPDRPSGPLGMEATRSGGETSFPAPQAAVAGRPGPAPNAMTRDLTISPSLVPTTREPWTRPHQAGDLSPIGSRAMEGGLGASSNGAIERLLREQNDLIRHELQRDASRPIAAPPPLRGGGLRM